MRLKLIFGVVAVIVAASVLFYFDSQANEEINEWAELTSSDSYLSKISNTFYQTSKTNEKLEKALVDVESVKKKKEVLKTLEEVDVEFNKIKTEIENHKMEKELKGELKTEIEKLKKIMITYLEIQDEKVKLYKEYVKNGNEMNFEKIAKLDVELQKTTKDYEKTKNEIEKHFK